MTLHNKPFHKITFQDVKELCEAQTLESVTLDYKAVIPRDLSKHFATFSNTLGGLIIIGVEEDPTTGKPIKYEGIEYDAKIIDQIHQHAANVLPYPTYEVRYTDDENSKVFILIRILEGDQPPYTTIKDPIPWMRTGNISTPLRNPDSRELENMYQKRNKAPENRQLVLNHTADVYKVELKRAQEEQQKEITGGNHDVTQDPIGSFAAMLRVDILPASPTDSIIDYRLIKRNIEDYRAMTRYYGDFPELNHRTVPGGIAFFKWSWTDGSYSFGMVNDRGLVHTMSDILRFDKQSGRKDLYLSNILGYLHRQLEAARKFYELAGYNGLLYCKISIDNLNDTHIYGLQPDGYTSWLRDNDINRYGSREWELSPISTFTLNDAGALRGLIVELIEKMYWDFDMSPPSHELIYAWTRQMGWNIAPEKK